MAGAAVEIGWAELDRMVRDVGGSLDQVGDSEQLLDEIGAAIEHSVSERFRLEVGPDNVPWEPTRRGVSILKGSPPQLMSSITRRVSRDKVEVGTNKIYAAIHQFGGTIRPKSGGFLVFRGAGGETVFAREVTIPARPYLGIDQADEREIRETIRDFIAEAFPQ